MDPRIKAPTPPHPGIEKVFCVEADLWKRICFLVEGVAIMETLRQSHPTLQYEFTKLARAIEIEKQRKQEVASV